MLSLKRRSAGAVTSIVSALSLASSRGGRSSRRRAQADSTAAGIAEAFDVGQSL
jgi:hypothetical protein